MSAASTPNTANGRRHDLDWLRAFAILGLLFFHAAMPFVAEWDWHIRNGESSHLLLEFNFFLSRFRMALLFVIAGVATHFLLRRRRPCEFLRDRALRLLVPLLVGVLVVVPPQVYFERLADGGFTGSFLAFWPRTLRFRPYPAGDTSYHHLWFIFYLFLYGVLLTPAIAVARTARGAVALARVRAAVATHGLHWLAVPIVVIYAATVHRFSGAQNLVDDVPMFVVYFLYYASGWLIGNDDVIWTRIAIGRRAAFTTAVLALLVINTVRWNAQSPTGDTLAAFAWRALLAAHAWAWVLTLLGYGRVWLNRDHAVLRWARDASYPFYILHQTVIVVIAFYVVQTPEPVITKFLFTSFVSLGVTLALYETLVRPSNAVRWLFGMHPLPLARPRSAAVQPPDLDAGAVLADTAQPAGNPSMQGYA